ncbi:hypothetical protein D9M68_650280 [compost metagenome]
MCGRLSVRPVGGGAHDRRAAAGLSLVDQLPKHVVLTDPGVVGTSEGFRGSVGAKGVADGEIAGASLGQRHCGDAVHAVVGVARDSAKGIGDGGEAACGVDRAADHATVGLGRGAGNAPEIASVAGGAAVGIDLGRQVARGGIAEGRGNAEMHLMCQAARVAVAAGDRTGYAGDGLAGHFAQHPVSTGPHIGVGRGACQLALLGHCQGLPVGVVGVSRGVAGAVLHYHLVRQQGGAGTVFHQQVVTAHLMLA